MLLLVLRVKEGGKECRNEVICEGTRDGKVWRERRGRERRRGGRGRFVKK